MARAETVWFEQGGFELPGIFLAVDANLSASNTQTCRRIRIANYTVSLRVSHSSSRSSSRSLVCARARVAVHFDETRAAPTPPQHPTSSSSSPSVPIQPPPILPRLLGGSLTPQK
ncbi:hypothetical protein CIHG_02928 [Coccidioides immitis H538.4]|uniref:Uncharacterized protein n=3 Tax=Coccidioides immitis TaxID=5501 RepID=A0A0J8R1G7_COCIT|nr:hypothetical protein CIRG_07637 [Coccidioides immitis RMSCC 2394]KMU79009.1 hypothetical protein CISG_07316 [Coccidioides immitis RMSCC 3703]KMU85146.1 hypothetical protein CIHG_02928 [Coccidioides immitis H538.4]